MSTTHEQVVIEALRLDAEARAALAEQLLESLGLPPDPARTQAWLAEVARRRAQVEAGQARLVSADDLFSEIESLD